MGNDLTWALAGLAWSVLGFGVGYAMGRIGCEVHEVKEALVPSTPTRTSPGPAFPNRRKGDRRALAFGLLILVMAVLTVASSVAALVRLERLVECQSRYNVAAGEAIQVRTVAAQEDRESLNALIAELALATVEVPDPVQRTPRVQAALMAYQERTTETNLARAASPFPPPPQEVCR